jgi:hypothetical protein
MKVFLKDAKITNYRIFVPKIKEDFLREYNLKERDFLSASNYLKDKWVLIIKKQ